VADLVDEWRELNRMLDEMAPVSALLLDYRLAPESNEIPLGCRLAHRRLDSGRGFERVALLVSVEHERPVGSMPISADARVGTFVELDEALDWLREADTALRCHRSPTPRATALQV
jgi:hypothetical protein